MLLEHLEEFRHLRVAVIGEAMLDSYLYGSADRLCREAPVPIVALHGRHDVPGGAANAAVNVRALGASVEFLSVVGADPEGDILLSRLEEAGVDTSGVVRSPTRETLVKQRVMAASQILLRLDRGTESDVAGADEEALLDALRAAFRRADAVIVSDYGYGILTPRLIEALAEEQGRSPRVLVADAKQLERYRDVGVTAAKPNYGEALRLLHEPALHTAEERLAQVAGWEEAVLEKTGARIVAVTLDVEGALVFEQGQPAYRTFTQPHSNANATGAGDTFVSALALALAAGADTPAAADLASAAATVVVQRDGTTVCKTAELRDFLTAESKVLDKGAVLTRIAALREGGRRVVFTNGCFDLLHRGHITYLNQAKALGDVLVVGLNDDASVRRLKGETRPINPTEDRAQVLAALSCVDLIVPFSEDTPAALIEALRPDVYVKGGDYTRETLPEAPLVESLGGEVRLLSYLDDRSTTGIIERVRRAYATGT
ncbi:D-glycero-beta-D-manno-heptose 1-phosphate adenylyltransferase (plasmid) [Deinococcus metallilatus]|uniref:Bifunctional protein HldE n=1 Tax=Deinococcus metallilatus TaxID=1211322 RepID=A0AAJ5F5Y8_9DEIO|nr:D-glycero-beta-D-manno-heptose 1-phosphate adenylyltransferase [Deinococcus metallilatus]MBB5293267.1 D-beta-D-heptose 7-phosphate kinase/D-beta-D-heptose 1-phosphate adenosyltransferase [Deinococcus metallilatus]QBY07048.1 D-glycero-beta-D-manno-heptose 1-phosphate adenylyltransferase [Deinococcus metallilatus]RXJ18059.1 D-glycero-beta-D-manno-heptose 1-phosphate adenylyltransferase [Deinococcus metallilatus]TLK31995.1 D-glycero-beta-D-manno-heptose 1-phosphate adenylyltransferase [Deinococ